MGVHSREGGLTFAQIKRKTPVPRPALQSKQSSLCSLHCNEDRGREGPNGQIVSVKRAADWRGREAGRSLMKREKSFEMKEVREIDRKEAAVSRGFPIL